MLVVDEAGDLKQGTATVGVARQDTGTAGKVDNAQSPSPWPNATAAGHGVIDRELSLPKAGLTILPAATPPGCPHSAPLPPSPSWPG